ncbi:nuclear transport factor 2-like isoform X1 [Struthio camelus]|uniref:nuclear transport factor 2-like isoform X1 n=1 Tax=Struthio camelus TaxID=8801 RepID=UPI003603B31A
MVKKHQNSKGQAVRLASAFSDICFLLDMVKTVISKTAIMLKLMRLQFQNIQHSITYQDHLPAPDNCILSTVVGQLQIDDNPVEGFHQLFALWNTKNNWM